MYLCQARGWGYSNKESVAVGKVCGYIQNDLITNPFAILFAEFRNMLIPYMTDLRAATDFTKTNFRVRLRPSFRI